MNDEEQKKQAKRILRRQAEALWMLVITTPGMTDLAEPLKRAEHHFERLTQRQRVTVAVIASQLARKFYAIQTEESQEAPETNPTSEEVTAEIVRPEIAPTAQEVVKPDEIIQPGQDEIDDGSGTGE